MALPSPVVVHELFGPEFRTALDRVARSPVTVLITGETGTGKEEIARAIHQTSVRRDGPFLTVNCAAIPAELLEVELFGNDDEVEPENRRVGRFQQAGGGTLFLDQVDEIPLSLQVKLLRSLQQHDAATKPYRADDVRLIAATHCDLRGAIHRGEFRQDLYYRLNVFPIQVPPLRQCMDQLDLFIRYENNRLRAAGKSCPRFTAQALDRLRQHAWPGNLRQLSNLLEQMGILFPDDEVEARDLPDEFQHRRPPPDPRHRMPDKLLQAPLDLDQDPVLPATGFDLPEYLRQREMILIRQALLLSDGQVDRAARLLNLRTTTLLEKMRAYDIEDDGNRQAG
ncbi:MAG: sigma 54-interacting transcriptional regulator [Xanthomonadales bacterium]|nr:sigma 54-interacting transcriptional regulator [Xanthomonadales bacterium]